MEHSRFGASTATLLQQARKAALALTLSAATGCAYSASASWSLGSGLGRNRPAMPASAFERQQREESLAAASRPEPERVASASPRARRARAAGSENRRPDSAQAKQGARARAISEPEAEAAACYTALERAGVSYESIANAKATGVEWPIRLTGALGGIRVQGANATSPSNYLDCRLARALLSWAPQLRAAGVVGLQHYSLYREGAVVAGAGTVSGHAHGYAIDVASFALQDGRRVRVLEDWTHRARGKDPCGTYPDDAEGSLMRTLVCDAAQRSIFQLVLTPHYNDAHANHLHLEITEDGTESFVR